MGEIPACPERGGTSNLEFTPFTSYRGRNKTLIEKNLRIIHYQLLIKLLCICTIGARILLLNTHICGFNPYSEGNDAPLYKNGLPYLPAIYALGNVFVAVESMQKDFVRSGQHFATSQVPQRQRL